MVNAFYFAQSWKRKGVKLHAHQSTSRKTEYRKKVKNCQNWTYDS